MRISFFQVCLLTLLSVAQWQSVLSAGAQYCQKGDPEFCMAVSSKENASRGKDIYLSISATPHSTGGWFSIGIGAKMAGALMFILYTDASQEQLAISVRTATGHVVPTVVTDTAPEINVTKAIVVPETGTYLAEIVCYSCDKWPGVDFDSASQPWMFAENRGQVFNSLDTGVKLDVHQSHGHLAVDMHSTLLSTDEPVPPMDSQKQSFGIRVVTHGKGTTMAVKIHGFIMTICFMGIFYFGTVAIRWPHSQSFRLHWVAQLIASLLAIASAAYMLSRAKHLGTHKIIGLVATSLLILQGWLGYKHHIVFVQQHRRSLFSTLHVWLGRSVLCLGIFNIGTGMYYAGWSAVALAIWLAIVVSELGFFIYVSIKHRRRKQQETKSAKVVEQEGVHGDDENGEEIE
ncbi:hypothetical protein C8Q69DRAFT_140662 [Paecilomyces variotii]|uniref:Cytochrome b561 domain-containing protein n=1 Tax=Byssochlamys spectabilis TaxID=264951 RepID=A0A443I0H8_BYSSP|nr:hypothetical protein C8Q69DRAFT_140662 [Paecilomyces variotii]RWQ97559.1 hypothetical protein C8Q69DRAFT_140662 [Paecilomyces variotii]